MPLKAAYKAYYVDQTRRFYQKRRLRTVNNVYETARPSGHGLQISNQNIKCAIDYGALSNLNGAPIEMMSPNQNARLRQCPYVTSNLSFLPERDYVTFGLLSQIRLSVCRLSVTLMHPIEGV